MRKERALAIVAGVLLGAAFLPGPFGFLAWFGYVPLLMALDARRARGASGWSLVPGNQRCGSFKRVLVMLITGTAMRLPVAGPRLDWRMSGRPGSSSFWSARTGSRCSPTWR